MRSTCSYLEAAKSQRVWFPAVQVLYGLTAERTHMGVLQPSIRSITVYPQSTGGGDIRGKMAGIQTATTTVAVLAILLREWSAHNAYCEVRL